MNKMKIILVSIFAFFILLSNILYQLKESNKEELKKHYFSNYKYLKKIVLDQSVIMNEYKGIELKNENMKRSLFEILKFAKSPSYELRGKKYDYDLEIKIIVFEKEIFVTIVKERDKKIFYAQFYFDKNISAYPVTGKDENQVIEKVYEYLKSRK